MDNANGLGGSGLVADVVRSVMGHHLAELVSRCLAYCSTFSMRIDTSERGSPCRTGTGEGINNDITRFRIRFDERCDRNDRFWFE